MSCMHRLGSLSPRISRQAVWYTQTRLFSSLLLQRARPSCVRTTSFMPMRDSRNFWWSSSSKTTPVQEIKEEPVIQEQEPSLPEQPPAETASVVESPNALESVPITGTELPSVPTEVPLPDIPVALPSPLHYGDLAVLGLASWTPAGLCRWGIELLQVSTGMPWFWTIVSATLITRLVLFPLQVKSMQATAAMAPYQKDILVLRDKMQAAQKSKDMLALQSVAIKQRMIYEKAGVSMAGMAALPIIQIPITLGMFFGVKKLCDLPLEQLKYSGISFWPDLTVADPTCILPIASAVIMNIQLSLGMKDMASAAHAAHMVNFFRVLSIVSIPLMWNLPAGVMVYLVTSVVGMVMQTLLLRQPAVRKALGIPVIPAHLQNKPASFMDSIEFAKNWWKEKKEEQETAIRASRRR